MKYNRLLGRAWRAMQVSSQPKGTAIDEERASGRTTALVLFAMSEAISNPGEWITIKDHHNAGQAGQDRVVNEALSFATQLELKFFEKRTGRFGKRNEMVSQIRCDLFTDNPWSIT